jgi:ATP-binding cassette, subfamily C, bacterial
MKYPIVLQHSEEDCGAACLATVAKSYGRTLTISRVREAVGTGQLGTTLLGLRRGAESLGFNARSVKATSQLIDRINEAPLPAIIHWKGYHWVVLYGQKGKKYVIADPGIGVRYLTREALTASWNNGVMLLLVPDESRFYGQPSDRIPGFGRFLHRVWHYRHLVAQVLPLNLAIGLLSLAFPLLLQVLTDDVLVRKDTGLLITVANRLSSYPRKPTFGVDRLSKISVFAPLKSL